VFTLWDIFFVLLGTLGLILLGTTVLLVSQQTVAVIEVFGRFYKIKHAGLRLKFPWPIAAVSGRLSLRLQELRSEVSVKTKDNVFVVFPIAIQYRVIRERVFDAFYQLDSPYQQIESFILNIVRTSAAGMTLDELYTERDRISVEILQDLTERMSEYGYLIDTVLVDEPQPSEEVRQSFNRVIAAQREKEAAVQLAEAERIRIVAKAKAEAESKRLQGMGLAQQREEIAKGLKEAVEVLKDSMPGVGENVILAMLMMTNQFDTIRDAAEAPGSVILVPYAGDGAVSDLARVAAAFEAARAGFEAPMLGGRTGGAAAPEGNGHGR
jgi:regulator of protease activity HflC (stomatin/prohibitin superfamily)